MNRCKSCNALIAWATTMDGGKRIPIDPTPSESGNIRLVQGGHPGGGLGAEVLTKAQVAERRGVLYASHFVTCPNSAEHRRR